MNNNKNSYLIALLILGVLYFIFGFVTWLNGSLIAYLKIACELNTFQAMLVTFAFYISYFVMALPSSFILKKTGFKNGMMLGLLIMAVGALIFVPAATSRNYNIFLSGLFVIGTGLSLLQTAVNPYVTIIGPMESAAKRISIMGICNKVAGVLAPLILGAVILANADELVEVLEYAPAGKKEMILDELALRVINPYLLMAGILLLLALFIRLSPLKEIREDETSATFEDLSEGRTAIFQFPNLILGVLAIFVYVGVEVIAGDTLPLFGADQGIPLSEAKYFTAFTLTAMVAGYLIGIFTIPNLISQSRALAISAISGVFFGILAILTQGYTAVVFIALLGLSNALMWPAIWPLAINGLGRFTKTGSAMLIMAIAGGALLPLAYGKLADLPAITHQQAYWIIIPCYIYILWYAMAGYRLRKWR